LTIKAIHTRPEIERTVHEAAKAIVELIQAANAAVRKLGGDSNDAETRILGLVRTDD
jgi:hypothetical protein